MASNIGSVVTLVSIGVLCWVIAFVLRWQ